MSVGIADWPESLPSGWLIEHRSNRDVPRGRWRPKASVRHSSARGGHHRADLCAALETGSPSRVRQFAELNLDCLSVS